MGMYDLLMLVIFLGAVIFGAWKGLAWQIASFAAVVVSYFVAINFREPVAAYISAEPPWNKFGAMLLLFLGTNLVIWLIFGRARETIKRMHLGGFDRQAGALLGAAKGALLCMVVTMFAVTLFGERTTQAICSSRSGGYIASGINQLTTVVPDEIHDVLNPYVERFNQELEQNKNLGGAFVNQQPNPTGQTSQTGAFSQPNGQPIYGGGQTSTANSQPQFGQFNPYQQSTANPNYQNYQGQWQTPNQQNQGYANPQYRGVSSQGYPAQGNPNGQPQYSQYPQQNTQQQPLITPGQNGWPDVNVKINSKELMERGADFAKEAARQMWENQMNGNR